MTETTETEADDWEPCDHYHDDECYDYQGFFQCLHQHCFNCGQCGCPGYCDDYQTYNLRPAETGGASCPVCRDTGIVQCAEQDGAGMYETACTEPGCTTPFPVAADIAGTEERPY
jgi:hypothetical protein